MELIAVDFIKKKNKESIQLVSIHLSEFHQKIEVMGKIHQLDNWEMRKYNINTENRPSESHEP